MIDFESDTVINSANDGWGVESDFGGVSDAWDKFEAKTTTTTCVSKTAASVLDEDWTTDWEKVFAHFFKILNFCVCLEFRSSASRNSNEYKSNAKVRDKTRCVEKRPKVGSFKVEREKNDKKNRRGFRLVLIA